MGHWPISITNDFPINGSKSVSLMSPNFNCLYKNLKRSLVI